MGTSSGIMDVAHLFDTPVLNVEWSNFGLAPMGKNNLYIPKKIKSIKTDRYLHFKEALEPKLKSYIMTGSPLFRREFKKLGLEWEDNSPQDLLEAAKEMVARMEGTFQYSHKQEKLMQAFQKLWSQSDIVGRNILTPIGIEWLEKNKDLYF